jgi:nitrogen-specific signal transduction histidine kinase
MNPTNLSEGPPVNEVTLVVCDAAGKVLAVSANAPQEIIACSPVAHHHFTEVFGENSTITDWLTEQIQHARREGEYTAESQIENGNGLLHVRLENLMCDQELYGFALTLVPARAAATGERLEEGDSLVSRKQWHEIKNYIGAMKLYATFLTKKLPEGDERQTIEKMLNGINNLIDYLARIRRGESK